MNAMTIKLVLGFRSALPLGGMNEIKLLLKSKSFFFLHKQLLYCTAHKALNYGIFFFEKVEIRAISAHLLNK